MSEYYAEKKDLKKSGEQVGSLMYGYGMYRFPTIKKKGVWCVMQDKKVVAECRGKAKCLMIVDQLNKNA